MYILFQRSNTASVGRTPRLERVRGTGRCASGGWWLVPLPLGLVAQPRVDRTAERRAAMPTHTTVPQVLRCMDLDSGSSGVPDSFGLSNKGPCRLLPDPKG